ncbi:rhodanese-like domain-containing protein [Sinomonas halotolerans]|uniref:Rhodanese-like domain-containing protein n=1 Tax=Sinomonas halotolerans TaxID=1644133 RepID=A0ABU9WXD2_9MICC
MASPSTTSPNLAPPNLASLSPETLRQWIDAHEDLIVIDVRSAAEFETMHIRGSYNVPLPLLSEHTEDLAERLGKRVVLVCQSGVRAEQARQRLSGSGVDSAAVLEGGVPAFAAAGGDVVRGAQRWALERQVRMAAGGLVLAGLLAGKFVSPKLRGLSGAIGAGLAFSAATNTCAMGNALARMPWNKAASEPTAADAIGQIPVRQR